MNLSAMNLSASTAPLYRAPVGSLATGSRSGRAGFSLVEVVIAVGIAAFCLVVMLGLIPTGLSTNKDSSGETAAANIARNIFSDLRATAKTNSTSSLCGITFPSGASPEISTNYWDDAGATNSTNSILTKYRSTVTVTSNSSPVMTVSLLITWPHTAATNTAPGRYEVMTAVDRRFP